MRRLIPIVVAGFSLSATAATATDFYVTKHADTADGVCDTDCSLREAVIAANANAGADDIYVPVGTYALSLTGAGENLAASGDLDLTDPVEINGRYGSASGDTIIDGNLSDRIFDVRTHSTAFTNLVMTGGLVAGIFDGTGGGLRIIGNASLVLNDSTVRGNHADNGGGAYIDHNGNLVLVRSTVSGNHSEFHGGGILSFGSLLVHVATFSGNMAGVSGGGEGGAINNNTNGYVYMRGSTIAGNTAATGGGGIYNVATFALSNTILALNTNPTVAPDCFAAPGTPITSEGYNIFGESSGCAFAAAAGDQVGTSGSPIDPLLGPLQDNGGQIETRALLAGSPAIDAGNPAPLAGGGNMCNWTDQRGVPHSWGTGCDIGAYEVPCGDGAADIGEQCDDGNVTGGDCCSPHCAFESTSVPCDDNDVCTQTDHCDGLGSCQGSEPLDCSDGNICTADLCDPADGCDNPGAPVLDCKDAPKAILILKQNGGAGDKQLFKWVKGEALDQTTELADPTGTTAYGFCIYSGPTNELLESFSLPAAGGKWDPIGTNGYKYKDATAANGGLTNMLLKGGAAGKTKVLVKGKGDNLPDPVLTNLPLPLTAQVINSDTGVCVEAIFSSGDVKKSTGTLFKAKVQ